MSETTLQERMASLAKDRRGWIPFAVLGVLLLLLSTALIVSLDTREDPEPDIDEQLVFDRGEASAQAAFRTAVRDATTEAGDAPITHINDSEEADHLDALQEVGEEQLLDEFESDSICDLLPPSLGGFFGVCDPDDIDPDFEDLPQAVQQNHIFENYVRLLVFEHASNQLDGAGQEIRGAETELSLQEAENHTERIERVDLTVGYEDNDLEPGMLGASIDGVELRARQDGELIEERTFDSLNVTIGTTLFELHNRTQAYENHLHMGFFEGLDDALDEGSFQGLGQEFALRLYPVAYAKSGVKYFKPTMFEEIASNRQSKLLANHAIYSVQEDVFGVSDPHSDTEMRIAAVCFAMDIAAGPIGDRVDDYTDIDEDDLEDALGEVFNESTAESLADTLDDEIDFENIDDTLDAENVSQWVCNALRDALGDGGGDDILPSFDEVLNGLIDDEDGPPESEKIYINTSAALAYQQIINDDDELRDHDGDWDDWQDVLELEDWTLTQDYIPDEDGEPAEVDEELDDHDREDIMQDFYEQLPFDDYEDEYGLDGDETNPLDTIETAYTVSVDDETGYSGSTPNPDPPKPSTSGNASVDPDGTDDDIELEVLSVDIDNPYEDLDEEPDREELFIDVELVVEQTHEQTQYWDCTDDGYGDCDGVDDSTEDEDTETMTLDITVDGEYAPGLDVDHADDFQRLEHAYTDGGDTGDTGQNPVNNFDGVPEAILEDRFKAGFTAGDFEDALNGDASEVRNGQEIIDQELYHEDQDSNYCAADFDEDRDCRTPPDAEGLDDAGDMEEWLQTELEEMIFGTTEPDDIAPPDGHPGGLLHRGEDPTVDPIEVDIEDFLEGEGAAEEPLLENLKDKIDEVEDNIVYQDTDGNYENVPDMARAQLYFEFVERLEDSTETSEGVRRKSMDLDPFDDDGGLWSSAKDWASSAKDKVLGFAKSAAEKAISAVFGDVLEFGRQAVETLFADDDDEDAGTLDSPLFEDVSFEVHGSPTYLTDKPDDRANTSAVREGGVGRFEEVGSFEPDDPLSPGQQSIPSPADDNKHSTLYAAYTNAFPYPGLPIIPGIHIAQGSLWNVQVNGEYPRFEATATTGDPASTTSYVREDRVVKTEIGGEEVTLGEVEPLDFQTTTLLGVLMPPGGVGDGGPQTWSNPEDLASTFFGCTDTYPITGPEYDEDGISRAEYLRDEVPGGDNIVDEDGELKIDGFFEEINDWVPFMDPLPEDIGVFDDEADEEFEHICAAHQLNELLSGLV